MRPKLSDIATAAQAYHHAYPLTCEHKFYKQRGEQRKQTQQNKNDESNECPTKNGLNEEKNKRKNEKMMSWL